MASESDSAVAVNCESSVSEFAPEDDGELQSDDEEDSDEEEATTTKGKGKGKGKAKCRGVVKVGRADVTAARIAIPGVTTQKRKIVTSGVTSENA